MLSLPRTWVQGLVGEPRSHKSHRVAKKNKSLDQQLFVVLFPMGSPRVSAETSLTGRQWVGTWCSGIMSRCRGSVSPHRPHPDPESIAAGLWEVFTVCADSDFMSYLHLRHQDFPPSCVQTRHTFHRPKSISPLHQSRSCGEDGPHHLSPSFTNT